MQSTSKPPLAPDAILAALVELIAQRTAELVNARPAADDVRPTLLALVSKQTLAAQLAISVAGVDRLVRDGKIPFVRVGDVRRFDPVAVRDALDSTTSTPEVASTTETPVRLLRRGSR